MPLPLQTIKAVYYGTVPAEKGSKSGRGRSCRKRNGEGRRIYGEGWSGDCCDDKNTRNNKVLLYIRVPTRCYFPTTVVMVKPM